MRNHLKKNIPLLFFLGMLFASGPVLADSDREIWFYNNTELTLKQVFGTARGNKPWELAANLLPMQQVKLNPERMRICPRIIITWGENFVTQFYSDIPPGDASKLTLRMVSLKEGEIKRPKMLCQFGRGVLILSGGVPYDHFRGEMEHGLTEERYQEFLDPGVVKNADLNVSAIALADTSWDILPQSLAYGTSPRGKVTITAFSIKTAFKGSTLMALFKELQYLRTEPLILDLNKKKLLAFSQEAAKQEPEATLAEGLDSDNAEARWQALEKQFTNLDIISEDKNPVIRITLASIGVNYELLLYPETGEAVLHTKQDIK